MRDEIYRKLAQRYASEQPSILKEAAYNLAVANVVEADLWAKAEQAIARIKQAKAPETNALSLAAKKAYSSAIANCPICKMKMNLVKLLEDREGFYCNDHKIFQPIPKEDGGE